LSQDKRPAQRLRVNSRFCESDYRRADDGRERASNDDDRPSIETTKIPAIAAVVPESELKLLRLLSE
jgi:hypothetical protein